MDYYVEFQLLQDDGRPNDCYQDDKLVVNDRAWIPFPGDTVDLKWGEAIRCFVVVTRHFSCLQETYGVNIVVRDAKPEERQSRVSE